MSAFRLPTIPSELQWDILPLEWSYEPDKGLYILAGAKTDWFFNPNGSQVNNNAPRALFTPPDENFLLSAKVSVAFGATFDAGSLQVREADDLWAKLCFEYSPQGHPMVVSVVTRGVSDDCNSVEIAGSEIYLRVARMSRTLVFHYSHDGRTWHFVRYFALGKLNPIQVGFSAQSPTGQKCAAVFSDINYRSGTLRDNRNGE